MEAGTNKLVQLVMNFVLAGLALVYYFKPEFVDVISPEMVMGMGAAANMLLPYFRKDDSGV